MTASEHQLAAALARPTLPAPPTTARPDPSGTKLAHLTWPRSGLVSSRFRHRQEPPPHRPRPGHSLEAHHRPARRPPGRRLGHHRLRHRLRVHPQLDRQERHHPPALRPGRATRWQGRRRRLGRPRRRVPGPQRPLHPERQPPPARGRGRRPGQGDRQPAARRHLGSPAQQPEGAARLRDKGGPLLAATPFHLTYNANGLVVRVQEQYIP
jgi:hypothetical protein